MVVLLFWDFFAIARVKGSANAVVVGVEFATVFSLRVLLLHLRSNIIIKISSFRSLHSEAFIQKSSLRSLRSEVFLPGFPKRSQGQ
jgi:hypothetical protein